MSARLGEVREPTHAALTKVVADAARLATAVLVAAVSASAALGSTAFAQEASRRREGARPIGEWSDEPVFNPSPEHFTIELRGGAYRPELGPSFAASFGGDLGPLIAIELDYHLVRVPYVGPLQIGARVGWVEWNGAATSSSGTSNVGGTGLSLVPITVLASLRIDALAHYLDFPLVLTPKLGLDFGYFQTGTSGFTQAEGWSVGLDWGAQLALQLDFLDRRSARRLDEEWGLNHAEIFFEIFGSTMGSFSSRQLPLGSPLTWTAGLGFTF
ncbi:MAG: MXAN_2562 family outer membrane beta-barrel protein [Deltaproteobacteria bacterium]|jgi:hypothetical protein